MAYTTINKSSEHFNTKLYTGTGSSNALTGVGFQPDWVWFKSRNQAYHHYLFDVVRGVNKPIHSSLANAQSTQTDTLMSFDSDGFTLGSDTNNGEINSSGNTFASWNWKANGAGSSNTDGSITSTVSANTTSGFSIVSYTGNGSAGATVGHGLGVAPKMIIIKRLNSTSNWMVYHSGLGGADHHIWLDLTTDIGTDTNSWNNTAPTSTVFSMGNRSENNASGGTYIAYCFADVTGYSKFGSFEGNGQAFPNSPFIYLGFKPKFFMWKNVDDNTDGNDNWNMVDATAQEYNGKDAGYLMANDNNYNFSGNTINLLSNGVKIDVASSYHNQSGDTYIYMAFAEAPLVGSNNIPCTAR